jgi:hypothetical protein
LPKRFYSLNKDIYTSHMATLESVPGDISFEGRVLLSANGASPNGTVNSLYRIDNTLYWMDTPLTSASTTFDEQWVTNTSVSAGSGNRIQLQLAPDTATYLTVRLAYTSSTTTEYNLTSFYINTARNDADAVTKLFTEASVGSDWVPECSVTGNYVFLPYNATNTYDISVQVTVFTGALESVAGESSYREIRRVTKSATQGAAVTFAANSVAHVKVHASQSSGTDSDVLIRSYLWNGKKNASTRATQLVDESNEGAWSEPAPLESGNTLNLPSHSTEEYIVMVHIQLFSGSVVSFV